MTCFCSVSLTLPWTFDPLREHPDQRQDLFMRYQTRLEDYPFSFAAISGSGAQRLQQAVEFLEGLIRRKPGERNT